VAAVNLDRHDLAATSDLLQRWAAVHYGASAVVEGVYPMPGHAGISFGFDVAYGRARDALVVRVPPAGVRRSGNTDVLRQVPLLRAAQAGGVPVAEVKWFGDDEQWFGVPYVMVERLPGGSVDCWAPIDVDPASVRSIFADAASALAAIHAVDWRGTLSGWGSPRSVREEIEFWVPVLAKGTNEAWQKQAAALRDVLLERMPPEPEPALVHGDFYSNNWVCSTDRLLAVVDWEIAFIGAPLLDVAWLCMIYDPAGVRGARREWMGWAPSPESIVADYQAATGRPAEHLGWYRGLAAWRMAAITAMNHRLHAEGRRVDATWDLIAESFEAMVETGTQAAARG
jgi:aminoglycoside phosphotransferase (APT) family kinase protein